MKVHDPHEEGREYDPYDIYRRDNSAVVFKIVIAALLAFFIGLAAFAIFSPRHAVAHDWYEMSCCEISGDTKPDTWARCIYVPVLF